jgi:hypothetical protein
MPCFYSVFLVLFKAVGYEVAFLAESILSFESLIDRMPGKDEESRVLLHELFATHFFFLLLPPISAMTLLTAFSRWYMA